MTGVATHPTATGCALVGVTRNDGGKEGRRGRLLQVCEGEVHRVDGLFADLDAKPNAALALAAFHGGIEAIENPIGKHHDAFPFSGGSFPEGSDSTSDLAPLDVGPDPEAWAIQPLCQIDPEGCKAPPTTMDSPMDPSIVALAGSPGGVWLSTRDRLVFWAADGTLTSSQPAE